MEATQFEFQALLDTETLVMAMLPPSQKTVAKTAHLIERKPNLLPHGFTQKYGIDYDTTFSLLSNLNTFINYF